MEPIFYLSLDSSTFNGSVPFEEFITFNFLSHLYIYKKGVKANNNDKDILLLSYIKNILNECFIHYKHNTQASVHRTAGS